MEIFYIFGFIFATSFVLLFILFFISIILCEYQERKSICLKYMSKVFIFLAKEQLHIVTAITILTASLITVIYQTKLF